MVGGVIIIPSISYKYYQCSSAERGRTFYFRVNNHAIFMKGANYVPASTLPELSADADAGEFTK